MNPGLGVAKNVVEKQPEVLRELGYLEKACAQLHETIESVEVRFASVLAHTPGDLACEQQKSGYACELAEYIATRRKCVEDATCRLEDFRKRCEL